MRKARRFHCFGPTLFTPTRSAYRTRLHQSPAITVENCSVPECLIPRYLGIPRDHPCASRTAFILGYVSRNHASLLVRSATVAIPSVPHIVLTVPKSKQLLAGRILHHSTQGAGPVLAAAFGVHRIIIGHTRRESRKTLKENNGRQENNRRPARGRNQDLYSAEKQLTKAIPKMAKGSLPGAADDVQGPPQGN